MTYVLADNNNTLQRFPYTLADLRADNPRTSFPASPTDSELEPFYVYPVEATAPPAVTHLEVLQRSAEYVDGRWIEAWQVDAADEALITQRTEDQASAVRRERDALLTASDWTQAPDAFNAGANQDAWATYRQSLRELPDQPGFPWDVAWPDVPAVTPPAVTINYRAFYDALLVSPAYGAIRQRAVTSAPVLTSCVEFIAAIGDAKTGRPNPAAIQACVDLLCAAAQFTPEELQALADVMAVGGLDQIYTLPAT